MIKAMIFDLDQLKRLKQDKIFRTIKEFKEFIFMWF
ncbi:hypothetical protein CDLVIII_4459 [Clostridium sp. DL-VIII]|nr:hypothetical protein CDLVIII_4459 [Clostridium sp. DL-VIII]